MNFISFNTDLIIGTYANKDVLSAFKQNVNRTSTIHQGMTINEISEVVSEKVISVIKEQFQATRIEFEAKSKK